MKKSCKNCDFSKNRSSEEPCCSCMIGEDYPNILSHWKGSETEIVNYDDRLDSLEKKVSETNSGCGRLEMDYVKEFAELKKKLETRIDNQHDTDSGIFDLMGKFEQEIAEIKEDLKTVMEAFNIHSHKDIKKKLNEVIYLLNHISTYYESKGDFGGTVGAIKL